MKEVGAGLDGFELPKGMRRGCPLRQIEDRMIGTGFVHLTARPEKTPMGQQAYSPPPPGGMGGILSSMIKMVGGPALALLDMDRR